MPAQSDVCMQRERFGWCFGVYFISRLIMPVWVCMSTLSVNVVTLSEADHLLCLNRMEAKKTALLSVRQTI